MQMQPGREMDILPVKMYLSLNALHRTEWDSSFLQDLMLVFRHQFFHSFNKHLLSFQYVPSTPIGD